MAFLGQEVASIMTPTGSLEARQWYDVDLIPSDEKEDSDHPQSGHQAPRIL
jgi:hypothetical protein